MVAKKKKPVKKTGLKRNPKGQFLKGNNESRNQGRKKRDLSIPDILRTILNEPSADDKKITKLNAVMNKVVTLAVGGEKWAVEYLSDRTEGRAIERTVDATDEWKELIGKCGVSD